jgi:GDP/UDP-N,N'-diacetylbacillosamine 2-epimerase (hydrolysing)
MKRKICVITGSRADYGLLRWVMQGIKDDPDLTLQVIATGMHLSNVFGMTYREIEEDGFQIDAKIEIHLSDDTPIGIADSIASGISGCAKAFDQLKPDIILVLGDRFEIFAAATSALVLKIPVAHIHGGETTVGAYDETFRHSITKMSQIHFVAAEEYRRRVIQLGENPVSVHLVGGLGIESIKRLKLLGREALETSLGIKFQLKSLLITYHPVTLESESTEQQMKELLTALSNLKDTTLIFTMPNADTGGSLLTKMIEEFTRNFADAHAFKSLGQLRYLSCVALVDGVVGNSSSGLTEVPSFKKGTINIGTRQSGRLQASSVINCRPEVEHINDALKKLYSQDFRSTLDGTINPYGESNASDKVVKVLKNTRLAGVVQKTFYDL